MLGSTVFYVYIVASLSGTLYVGLTDNLKRRVEEHKLGLVDSFTKKYKVNRLMYYEIFRDAENAAQRERQIKKYRREMKNEIHPLLQIRRRPGGRDEPGGPAERALRLHAGVRLSEPVHVFPADGRAHAGGAAP